MVVPRLRALLGDPQLGGRAEDAFDDTRQCWYAEQPNAGVELPAAGVGLKCRGSPARR